MNYLNFFMIFSMFIGFLLVFLSFYSYSKLENTCSSDSLRAKLQTALGIGSTLMALSIGFFICTQHPNCKCSVSNDLNKTKVYYFVLFSLITSIILLFLTFGIKSELSTSDCKVDLDSIPSILGTIASIQLIICILYIAYEIKTLYIK